ncbi:MAG: PepSY-like domain-containing protein [Mangrovibacterium sp.]
MTVFRITAAAILLAALCSCADDDTETILSTKDIPTEIVEYVGTHFPDNPISTAIKEEERKSVSYEIFLQGGFELNFDGSFKIYDIDGATKLPDSVIPEAILTYVSENYAERSITDWELEHTYQQVELDNSIELEFQLDGTFMRIDND